MTMANKRVTYRILSTLGQGVFGTVFKAQSSEGELVAIKRVAKHGETTNREVEVLEILDHPNCIKMRNFFYTYDEQNNLWLNIIFEYMNSMTLKKVISKLDLNKRLVKYLFYQLCHALEHVHSLGIAHRDVKPDNILVAQNFALKLIDFGSAKMLDENCSNSPYMVSRYYRAPELLSGNSAYSTKIDVWSAGCIFWELLHGAVLFDGQNTSAQFLKIISVLGSPTYEDVRDMYPRAPKEVQNVLNDFVSLEVPAISFDELVPGDKIAADLLARMLRFSPSHRSSISDILLHPYFDDCDFDVNMQLYTEEVVNMLLQ
eukprot:TRINITY_DN3371_c0_g1_i2.p1 TRINITY_DN3371_c0_g1~~TRINITY_DN3371_c0_g1_i2.p1  ORF type:complete len:316 (+),score=28.27 TRINITY_DN3371_c0_g1_i2:43-990(+)